MRRPLGVSNYWPNDQLGPTALEPRQQSRAFPIDPTLYVYVRSRCPEVLPVSLLWPQLYRYQVGLSSFQFSFPHPSQIKPEI